MSDLYQLSRPFPDHWIEQLPGVAYSADYVSHANVTQKLLLTVGPFDWSVQVIDQHTVVGTLTCTVDGERVTVSGIGHEDDILAAESRALCRAAMRLGCGLHLWCRGQYVVHTKLQQREVNGGD